MAFSPDGTKVLTGVSAPPRIGGVRKLPSPADIHKQLMAEGVLKSEGEGRLWDVASGKPLGEPLRHDGPVVAVAFSPDGTKALTGSWDNTARLWDAATGKPLSEPLRHDGQIVAVAFSPDGTKVLTGSYDRTARLWDAATGSPLGEPLRHSGTVNAVGFSPDGTKVVTGRR